MSLCSPAETENLRGKDSSHSLGMTTSVITNPFAVLRVNSERDIFLLIFSKQNKNRTMFCDTGGRSPNARRL